MRIVGCEDGWGHRLLQVDQGERERLLEARLELRIGAPREELSYGDFDAEVFMGGSARMAEVKQSAVGGDEVMWSIGRAGTIGLQSRSHCAVKMLGRLLREQTWIRMDVGD